MHFIGFIMFLIDNLSKFEMSNQNNYNNQIKVFAPHLL